MKQLLCFLFALTIPGITVSQSCPSGMLYQECGSSCPLRCGTPPSPFCTFQCVQGCFCPSGLWQLADGSGCVAEADCPPPVVATLPPPTNSTACPSGMVHQTCGTACEPTCDNPDPLICTLQCVVGCFCTGGLLKHDGRCVQRSECPGAVTLPPPTNATVPPPTNTTVCPNGMIHNDCGTACPLTCEHPDPRPCTRQCVQGCFCPTGMLAHNGNCYQRDQCPVNPTCANGMIYETCGTACPLTCEHPDPRPCTRQCVQGCFCPSGMLAYNGNCYARDTCPVQPTCANGKVYQTCGSACPLTCENRLSPPSICPEICVSGCFCPSGMVEYNGNCYNPTQCPVSPTCANNQVYSSCGTACPITCENRLNPPQVCPDICVDGCFCPAGMVQHNGQCYNPLQCPVNPTCANNMVYSTCASACPLTCANRNDPPRPCPAICVTNCTCPFGMAEHEGRCYNPDDCPVGGTPTPTAPPPTTTSPTHMCFQGKHYACGTACPPTCDHPNNPETCEQQSCVMDCYCPEGMLHHLGGCVLPEDCPRTPTPTAPPPTTTSPTHMCFQGKHYTCGTACPPTCDHPNNPETCEQQSCVMDCYCPEGMLHHLGGCVLPENCPPRCPAGRVYKECGPVCPLLCPGQFNPCFSLRCSAGCFCPDGQVEHEGRCITELECPSVATPTPEPDPCQTADCHADQSCEVVTSGCTPEVDYCYKYPQCKDPPYVPCGQDAFLACDSEWTYCLQQNKTRRASCVSSCLSTNGYCEDDEVCITTVPDEGATPRIKCVDTDDLPTNCPAGQMMDTSDCPSSCHETCDDVVRGTPTACPAVCGRPSCICPSGLVKFRDRCVDPRLCFVLVTYPPPINPLPVVDRNTVLLSLFSDGMDSHQFRMEDERDRLTNNILNTLVANGHDGVDVGFHGVYDNDNMLQIVVQISGSGITSSSADAIIAILSQNSAALGISVQQIAPVDVVYVEDDQYLSQNAIIGIAVSSGVAGIAVIVAWIAVVACCCVLRGRNRSAPPAYQYSQGQKFSDTNNNVYYCTKDHKVDLSEDSEKGKLVLESLCD